MKIKNYLAGRIGLMHGDVNLVGANIVIALVKQGSTFMTDTMVQHMSDFTDLKEMASMGYTRPGLTGYTITPDWARDRAVFTADDPLWAALADDDLPIAGAIVIQATGGGPTADIPLYGYQLNTPVNPGGEDYTFPFSSDGISEI